MKSNVCDACLYINRAKNRFCTQCGAKLNRGHNQACLYIFHEQKDKNLYMLDKNECTIGRGHSNTIIIDDKEISNHHAVIYFKDGIHWVKDLQSRNGVDINGKRIINSESLYDNCHLKLGTTILRYEADDNIDL